MTQEKPVLASGSPRRRELLALIFPSFDLFSPDADETVPPGLPAGEAPELLARRKAENAVPYAGGRLVIAADTLVTVDEKILGKPLGPEDACSMLRLLSGRSHRVYTGVCLRRGVRCRSFTQCTEVTFYPLSEEEIRRYVAGGEPLDKAGAYGIQGEGALLVEKIKGDYYNVVGLPVARLSRELASF